MSSFELNVRRADDLLVLRFEFLNLEIDPDDSVVPRRLIRTSPAGEADAMVIVHFPPQHIAEEVFAENGVDFTRNSKRLLAGESRLAFRLPSNVDSIPLALAELLDWGRLEPLRPQDEEPVELGPNDFLADSIREPEPHHTAIELPFRVTLSPDSESRWEHGSSPAAHDGRVELWHTRLVPTRPVPAARVVAVWSPDVSSPLREEFPQSLTSKNRSEIVRISSLRWQRHSLQDLFMEHPEFEAEAERWATKLSRSLFADELMLSALGGWLRIRSRFNVPPIPPFLLSDQELLGLGANMELFSLEEWKHTIAMGRDRRAGTVERGFLFPFGHRANRVTITEREFTSNGVAAEREGRLIQQSFILIQEPERRYVDNPGMPFTSIRILLNATPDLGLTGSDPFVPTLNGMPFAFPIALTDHAGAVVETTAAAVWVPRGPHDQAAVAREYAKINRVDFAHQLVTFTPRRARNLRERRGSTATDNTTMTTVAIEFRHRTANALPGDASFQPEMAVAHVRIPALDQFALRTTKGPVAIAFHDRYLQVGAEQAPGGVFATIVGGVRVDVPASTAGGLIDSLGVKLTGLSLDHGVVPNVDEFVDDAAGVGGAAIEGIGGKLLGQFELGAIIGEATTPEERPTITTSPQPGLRVVTLDWKPALVDDLPKPLAKVMTPPVEPSLSIKAVLSQPDGTPAPAGISVVPSTEVNGTLAGVALELFEVLRIEFASITFHMKTAQKPEFTTTIGMVTFVGDLEFVNDLASLLHSAKGGPTVNVTPAGISAGLTLAVPEFGLGAFSLQNLAVSIEVNLYFSARPLEIRFALSSRERPFLMSYSLFGGGGYFALVAKSDGTFDVEAAFEMGAAASINLVVAEAKAQVMLGIMFSKRGDVVELGGYLRIFGSLEILGIATVSVDFQLSLTYAAPNAIARASLTVAVRVLGVSKSVTITVQRSFNMENLDILTFAHRAAIPSYKSFREAIPLTECWVPYCDAFAAEER